jgi:cytosine/adenosine deaminase-related metal-dependent hydrolase
VVPEAGRALDDAWLRIHDGRVVGLGSGSSRASDHDLGDCIVLPGLVNAHTHLEFSTLETPLAGTDGLPAWIARVVELRRSRPHAPDYGAAALDRGLAESAAAGVTSIGEISTGHWPTTPPRRMPRVCVFREGLGLSETAAEAARHAVRRDLARLAAAGIATGISPHAPYSVSTSLGRSLLAIAARLRLPAAMHLAESEAEAELLASGSGEFRALLDSLGAWPATTPPRLTSAADWISLLARGPRGLVVHGTFLDDGALARFARHRDRLTLVICPRTTRLLSGALPPLPRFRAAGLRVAIGTDSRASNPDLSVLAECRALVDGGLASPSAALHMATVNGAWALGFERSAGVLATGRPADLVILRPIRPWTDPHEAALDPETTVVATLRAGRVIHGGLTG